LPLAQLPLSGRSVLAIASVCAVLAVVALALEALADAIDALGDASLAQTVDTAIQTVEDIPGFLNQSKLCSCGHSLN
jgi:hypothetical protein